MCVLYYSSSPSLLFSFTLPSLPNVIRKGGCSSGATHLRTGCIPLVVPSLPAELLKAIQGTHQVKQDGSHFLLSSITVAPRDLQPKGRADFGHGPLAHNHSDVANTINYLEWWLKKQGHKGGRKLKLYFTKLYATLKI